jgi:integrase/recombinase XerC
MTENAIRLLRRSTGTFDMESLFHVGTPRTGDQGSRQRRREHVQGKGRKQRTVTLNWTACKAVKAYLAVRPDAEDDRLFVTKFRRGMGPRAIERVVEKYLDQAGIAGASVHSLRHTFATHQTRRGTKLDFVRQALGHESLATTSICIDLALEVMDKELRQNAL